MVRHLFAPCLLTACLLTACLFAAHLPCVHPQTCAKMSTAQRPNLTLRVYAVLAACALLAALGLWWAQAAGSASAQAQDVAAPISSARNLPFEALPTPPALDPALVALGRKLFHDPRLSADGRVACASCHALDTGGVDHRVVSLGVGGQAGAINAPTVYNAALNFRQFWDGRAGTLEEQAGGPLTNPVEMASDWPKTLSFLEHDTPYRQAFAAVFSDGVTQANVRHAIASFERTLITPGSAFDHYLGGELHALSDPALAGFRLFRQIGCASCHQGVNLGGNLYQKLGIMEDYFAGKPFRPADQGRFNVTHDEADRHYFKVPSLRNVALTGPYLHDASAASLEDAVRAMARYQLALTLSPSEVKELVAFLNSLSAPSAQP